MILLLVACAAGDSAADTAKGTSDPTLQNVQAEVFTASCAFSTCHGSPGASDLTLEDGASWAELVSVDSVDNPGHLLVTPGDADGSYLVQKLEGSSGIVGVQMPQDGTPLDDTRLQLVKDWIDAGAADD